LRNRPRERTSAMVLKKRVPKLKIGTQRPTQREAPAGLTDEADLIFGPDQKVHVKADELIFQADLGRGTFGLVTERLYEPLNIRIAVKHIRQQDEPAQRTAMMRDLEVCKNASDCKYTVTFYGGLFREDEVWICMEVMDMSLYDYYKDAHKFQLGMTEIVLGAVCYSVLSALKYLKEQLKVIHRDVKPSNILLRCTDTKKIEIKLCDFGIAGNLINSLAKTNVGCKPYMAPERIDTQKATNEYGANSDIWSLGISIVEMATGAHPYNSQNAFLLLRQIMNEPSPTLEQDERFSQKLADFVNRALQKDEKKRATFNDLLEHNFLADFTDDIESQPERIFAHYNAVQQHKSMEQMSS